MKEEKKEIPRSGRVGPVVGFKPRPDVREFLEEYCEAENRNAANAAETLILSSPAYQEWASRQETSGEG